MNAATNQFKLDNPQTDAELVASVAALDDHLARVVQARLRALRLQRVLLASHTAAPPGGPGIWHYVHRAAARLIRHDLIH